ncbi:MAG: translocation/assembly module TamB domain-containing protein [Myxococcota bacterium]
MRRAAIRAGMIFTAVLVTFVGWCALYPYAALNILKPWLLDTINDSIAGSVSVGLVRGDGWSALELQDVVLFSPEGQEVARVDRLGVEWQPWALIDRIVRVQRLTVSDSQLTWLETDSGSNLSVALQTKAASKEDASPVERLPVQIAVERFEIGNFRLIAQGADSPRLEQTLGAQGTFGLSRERVAVFELEARGDDNHVTARSEGFELSRRQGSLELTAAIGPPLISLITSSAVRCDATAKASLRSSAQSSTLDLTLELGRSSLSGTARLDPDLDHHSSTVTVHLSDANHCIRDAPSGQIELEASNTGSLSEITMKVSAQLRGLALEDTELGGGEVEGVLHRSGERFAVDIGALSWKLRELDVTGSLRGGRWGPNRVAVEDLELRGNATKMRANFDVDRRRPLARDGSAVIHIDVPTLIPWSKASGVELAGSAKADVELSLGPTLSGQGSYAVQRVSVDGSKPFSATGKLRTEEQTILLDAQFEQVPLPMFDELRARISMSEQNTEMAAVARRGFSTGIEVSVDGDIGWKRFERKTLLNASWQARASGYGLDASMLRELLPENSAIRGPIELFAAAEYKRGISAGTVELQTPGVTLGPKWAPVVAGVRANLANETLKVDLSVEAPIEARLEATTGFPLTSWSAKSLLERDPQVTLRVAPFDLQALPALEALTGYRGTLGIAGRYRERVAQIEVDVSQFSNPYIPILLQGRLTAMSDTSSTELVVDLDEPLGGSVRGIANIAIGTPELLLAPGQVLDSRGELEVNLDNLSVDRVIRSTALRRRAAGNLELRAVASGTRNDWKADVRTALRGGVLGRTVFRNCELHTKLNGDTSSATLDIATRDNQTLNASLNARQNPTESLTGTVKASNFSLSWVREVASTLGLESYLEGRVDSDLDFEISPKTNRVDGSATLREGSAQFGTVLPPITDLSATLDFAGDSAKAMLSAKSGGGRIQLDATGTGFTSPRVKGEVRLRDVPLNVDRVMLKTNLNIDLAGAMESGAINGKLSIRDSSLRVISLDDTTLLPTDELERVRYKTGTNTGDGEETAPRAPSSRMRWALEVETDDPVSVDGESVNASVETTLSIQGGPSGPSIRGEIEVPQGNVTVGPHRYEIEESRIVFRGKRPINPRLKTSLLKQFDEPPTSFYVRLNGTARSPALTFGAQPSIYDQAELVGFFLGGRPGASAGGDVGQRDVAAALAGLATSRLQREIKEALPIDTLDLGVGVGGEAASLTTGKWITPDLFVAYTLTVDTSDPSGGPGNTGLLRYRITPRWTIEMRVEPGNETSGSADLVWVRRF